jgi:hypothetical protein
MGIIEDINELVAGVTPDESLASLLRDGWKNSSRSC